MKSGSVALGILGLSGCLGGDDPDSDPDPDGTPTDDAPDDGDGSDGSSDGPQEVRLTHATGAEGSLSLDHSVAFSAILSEQSEFLRLDPITSPGPDANIRIVSDGDAELGGVWQDLIGKAWNGEDEFDEPIRNVVNIGYTWISNPTNLYTFRDRDDITDFESLRGQNLRLSPGPAGGGTTSAVMPVLETADIVDELQIDYFSYSDMAEAVRNRNVDVFALSPLNTSTFNPGNSQILESVDVKLIPYPDELVDTVTGGGLIAAFDLDSSTYNVEIDRHDIPSTYTGIGLTLTVFVGRTDLAEDTVYELVKTYDENLDQIQEQFPLFNSIGFGDDGIGFSGVTDTVPFHPGAARYYEEIGEFPDRFSVHEE